MTAYATGTASDHTALFNALVTFLTSNADLVSTAEEWSVEWEHDDGQVSGVVLQGPGLAGQDEVLVGMRLVSRPTPDEYEIQLVGMTGVLPGATEFNGHVNTTPFWVRMFVDDAPMTYWFTASGRRFTVVCKISTVFQSMYGGLILPYAPPENYGYPLFIGGSAGYYGPSSWRSTDSNHRHFVHSHYDTGTAYREPSAWLLSPQGDWLRCSAVGSNGNVALAPRKFQTGLDVAENSGGSTRGYGYATVRERLMAGFADEFPLTPITLVQASPSDQTYGVLEGVYHVPGHNNSSENIVTVSSVDHLVVQDVFRTSIGEYWALKLE